MIFTDSKKMSGIIESDVGVKTPQKYSTYPIKFRKLNSSEYYEIEAYINEIWPHDDGCFAGGFLLDGTDWYRVNLVLKDNNRRGSILIFQSSNYPTISNKAFVEYFEKQISGYTDIRENIKENSVE